MEHFCQPREPFSWLAFFKVYFEMTTEHFLISEPSVPQELDIGVVYKKTIGFYDVHSNGRVIPCSLSNKLRKNLIYPIADPNSLPHRVVKVKAIEHVDPIAVGDEVRFVDAQDGTGMIVELLPRRNFLSRRTAVPMPTAHAFEQVFVANLDQVVAVVALEKPFPKWNLLDRYLTIAEFVELPALVCLTKLDLVKRQDGTLDEELQGRVDDYRRIGYPVILTSTVTGEGLEEMKQGLIGKVSVFLGKSGVGKTSILNAIQPGLGLRVKEVNRVTGKGKHTTTHLEMFPVEIEQPGEGTAIVDTPGVREFGLPEMDVDDLALLFREMQPFVGRCKFGLDCQHEEEPGCAIRKAVNDGKVSVHRYHNYLRLKGESSLYE
jgi:ribosome biogenesis GTPase / thiamine phosphate phosphatase